MVRFSDILGGSGEPEDGRAANSPFAELAGEMSDLEEPDDGNKPEDEPEQESVAEPDYESPEAVLERLTQYATSARAADRVATVDELEPDDTPDDDPPSPVGDDFLPHPKGVVPKPGWGRKRRP